MSRFRTLGPRMLEKIVSGGQTGVDRAALDVAIELKIAHGGWCPKGRLAEDGRIDSMYQLTETSSKNYAVRTEQNVVSSDGTLILYRGNLTGGTLLTWKLLKKHEKPALKLNIDGLEFYPAFWDWIEENQIGVLNVAGPRESSQPGIYVAAFQLLRKILGSIGAG